MRNRSRLPPKRRKKLKKLAKMRDSEIDLSDTPEVKKLLSDVIIGRPNHRTAATGGRRRKSPRGLPQ